MSNTERNIMKKPFPVRPGQTIPDPAWQDAPALVASATARINLICAMSDAFMALPDSADPRAIVHTLETAVADLQGFPFYMTQAEIYSWVNRAPIPDSEIQLPNPR